MTVPNCEPAYVSDMRKLRSTGGAHRPHMACMEGKVTPCGGGERFKESLIESRRLYDLSARVFALWGREKRKNINWKLRARLFGGSSREWLHTRATFCCDVFYQNDHNEKSLQLMSGWTWQSGKLNMHLIRLDESVRRCLYQSQARQAYLLCSAEWSWTTRA